ncbi:MAG: hypothetical protein M3Y21_02920 [Candidatus Eremiobacteraeota bacterium]|nr:hypothetical protein [Candidatus Eremiobacteraeota bacterium]
MLLRGIEATIDEALPLLSQVGAAGDAAFSLRQTRANYLPQTVAAYLAVPVSQRDSPDSDGHTAHDQLLEQLSVLDRATKRDLESVSRQKRNELAVNARFLAERFDDRSTEVSPIDGDQPVSQKLPVAALANWLPSDTSDAKAIVAHLGTKFQVAFPRITEFRYSGMWGLGRIEAVVITLQQTGGAAFRYTLSAKNDMLSPSVTKLVHNVSIQTIPCSIDDWLQSLYDDLCAQARKHNETRNALARLLQ